MMIIALKRHAGIAICSVLIGQRDKLWYRVTWLHTQESIAESDRHDAQAPIQSR